MRLSEYWNLTHRKKGKKERDWNNFYEIKENKNTFIPKILCEKCKSTRKTNSGEIVHKKVEIGYFSEKEYICKGTRFEI